MVMVKAAEHRPQPRPDGPWRVGADGLIQAECGGCGGGIARQPGAFRWAHLATPGADHEWQTGGEGRVETVCGRCGGAIGREPGSVRWTHLALRGGR
jgi:hypothetical protein